MIISLIIPGRNEEAVIDACLNSVIPLLGRHDLTEILFVDDGSTDQTAEAVKRYPVEYVQGEGKGPAAARNIGWRKAAGDIVWFLDADCIAGPESLPLLLRHLDDPDIAGVGGSFRNACPHSLLSRIIHEEIMARHRRMGPEAGHLASGHVVYRREVLERLKGFDERFITNEDVELSYRISRQGYKLVFEPDSRVGHHYPVHLWPYIGTQFKHAFWRVHLYRRYREMAGGDDYSGPLDYVQPFIAWAVILISPFPGAVAVMIGLLILLQLPMAVRLMTANRRVVLPFVGLGFLRAFVHGFGLAAGIISVFGRGLVRCFL